MLSWDAFNLSTRAFNLKLVHSILTIIRGEIPLDSLFFVREEFFAVETRSPGYCKHPASHSATHNYHHHAPFNISPTHHRLQPFRISILKTNSLIHIPKKPCRRTQKSEARDSGSNGSGKRGRRGRQGAGTAEEAVGRAPYFSDRCVPEGAVHI